VTQVSGPRPLGPTCGTDTENMHIGAPKGMENMRWEENFYFIAYCVTQRNFAFTFAKALN